MEHVRSGVRLIQQLQNDVLYSRDKGMIPLQCLVPAFARLERQLQEMTGDPTPFIQNLAVDQAAAGFFEFASPNPQPVPHFSSLNYAWISLHQRWHEMISWSGSIHPDWFNHLGDVNMGHLKHQNSQSSLLQHVLESRQDFELWSLGFEDLGKRITDMTPREECINALLQCYLLLAESILGTASLSREMLWDDYRDHFKRIVGLCATVIELESGVSINTLSTPIVVQHRYAPNYEQDRSASLQDAHCPLTFDMGVCMLLFHVAIRCRDARIRLNAIKLLEDHPRLEGLWDGALIAKVGRAIDSVERQGASLEEAAAREASAAEIPLLQRMLHIKGKLSKNSRSADLMLYRSKKEGGVDTIPVCISVAW
jgi:hypothetical protein